MACSRLLRHQFKTLDGINPISKYDVQLPPLDVYLRQQSLDELVKDAMGEKRSGYRGGRSLIVGTDRSRFSKPAVDWLNDMPHQYVPSIKRFLNHARLSPPSFSCSTSPTKICNSNRRSKLLFPTVRHESALHGIQTDLEHI